MEGCVSPLIPLGAWHAKRVFAFVSQNLPFRFGGLWALSENVTKGEPSFVHEAHDSRTAA